jgi:hypothetical protein
MMGTEPGSKNNGPHLPMLARLAQDVKNVLITERPSLVRAVFERRYVELRLNSTGLWGLVTTG